MSQSSMVPNQISLVVVLVLTLSFFTGTVKLQKPTFSYVPSDQVVVLQSEYTSASVKFYCYVVNFDDSLTMLWYKNGRAISRNEDLVNTIDNLTDSDRYHVRQGHNTGLFMLDIEDITIKTVFVDRGSYRCVVEQRGNTVTASPSAELYVYVAAESGSEYPKCMSLSSLHNYTEGTTATLRCFTYTEITDTELEWSRSDQNATLESPKTAIGEFGEYFTEFVWTVSPQDDGVVYTCTEKNPHISTYPTCQIGPLIVSPPVKQAESMPFTVIEIIGIGVGGGLTLLAIIIIIIVVVVVIRRRRSEQMQFPKVNVNRRFEIQAETDFDRRDGRTRAGQAVGMNPGLGLGTLTQDSGENYYKRKTMQTPINLQVLSATTLKSTNPPQSASKVSLTQSEGKGSRQSGHSSVVDMVTKNGNERGFHSRPASDTVNDDVFENDPSDYQSLSPRAENLYTSATTLPST